MSKLDALLSSYGAHPLQDTSLDEQNEATPETILSLLYLAMLSSARISHQLAYKGLSKYRDLEEEYMGGTDGGLDKRWLHEIPREDCDRFRGVGRLYSGKIRYAIPERGLHKGCSLHHLRVQTMISTISSRKQSRPPPKSGDYFKKSMALANLARIYSSMLPKASGHPWHPSSTLEVWRPPNAVVLARM